MPSAATTAGSEEQTFGRALELLGQMPTLACRAAVNALMASSSPVQERAPLSERFRSDIDWLCALLAALKQGDPNFGVSETTAAELEQAVWADEGISEAIDGFVASAFFISVQLTGPATVDASQVRELGQTAAQVVTDAFERATSIVREIVNEQSAKDRRNITHARDLTTRTIEQLNDLTLRIQLISVNATVEAARAGAAGAGFGVIAQEINMLSVGARNAVNEISAGFGRLQ